MHHSSSALNGSPFALSPHPADPLSTAALSSTNSHLNGFSGPNSQSQQVPGHQIWVYSGNGGYVGGFVSASKYSILYPRSYTFWRFAVQIPLGSTEMKISYNINHGQELEFYVPGRNQNMRWAAHSVSDCSEPGATADDLQSAMDLVLV
jgi:hypothetical protein